MLKVLLLLVIFININPSNQYSKDESDDLLEKVPASINYLRFNNVEESCEARVKNQNKHAKSTDCDARPTIVSIDPKTKSTLRPSMVWLNKCVGHCSAKSKCVAIETKNKTIHVYEIAKGELKCTTRIVVEDLKCKCACPQKATDCIKLGQYYDRDTCKCKCNNYTEKQNCGEGKKWVKKNCTCVCKKKLQCSGTSKNSNWDEKTCRCKTK